MDRGQGISGHTPVSKFTAGWGEILLGSPAAKLVLLDTGACAGLVQGRDWSAGRLRRGDDRGERLFQGDRSGNVIL